MNTTTARTADQPDGITLRTWAALAANQTLQDRRAALEQAWREGNPVLRALVQHSAEIRHMAAPTLADLERAMAEASPAPVPRDTTGTATTKSQTKSKGA